MDDHRNGDSQRQDGGKALDAEAIRTMIVTALDAHDDVRHARSVESFYRDRLGLVVVDGNRQAWTVHVLRDPRPWQRTTIPAVVPPRRGGR